ncbi:MAG: hemolysin family protein [Oscillospiraceae bacterium]
MSDGDPTSIILKLVVLLVLILVNAFFAMSEMAIITLNDNKVRKLAEEGHKGAIKVLKLTENPSSFLSTIQIGVTLAGFLTSASAAENFSDPLSTAIIGWLGIVSPTMISFVDGLATVLVTIIIAYFSLVLGELAPKRIAMQCSEKVSYKIVGVLLLFKTLMRPFIKFLSVSTNLLVRALGFDPNASEEEVTEEEIRMMVDAGEEKGVIEESQKEMINNIFEFDDIVAADVMTHRTDISAVDISDSIDDVIEMSIKEGYSRIPVYNEELDDIEGILYVKDLLKYVGSNVPDNLNLRQIMRAAYFVPESKRCGALFSEMTEKHIQMVIVADEYGGVAGLVTIEDLLESIVGNIQDEYDNEDIEMEQLDEKTFTIDGTTDVEEVEELLDVKFPTGEFDTIGGFIMSVIGRIPSADEQPSVEYSGFIFTVEEMDERRIDRIRAERLPDEQVEDSEQ